MVESNQNAVATFAFCGGPSAPYGYSGIIYYHRAGYDSAMWACNYAFDRVRRRGPYVDATERVFVCACVFSSVCHMMMFRSDYECKRLL